MGLFSFLNKNKQDAASGKSEYRSQADEPFTNARTRATRGAAKAGKDSKNSRDNESDPMLPEKKRARRRLIGAVVLVLAVVIVLPMILDPEPKPLTDDIAIQIPSRDAKASASPSAPAPAPATSSAQPSDASSLDGKEELVDSKPAAAPAAAVVANKAPAAETPVAKPVDVAPLAAKPVEKPVDKVTDKAADKAVADKAALVAREKAEKAEKAAADKRASAEKAAAAKASDDQRALAILQGKPADKTPATAADKPAANVPAGKFVIQVAALATQEKIDELRGKLSSAGISSYTQKVATKDGDRTRIRVGPFNTRDEADKARAKIVKLGLNATLIPT